MMKNKINNINKNLIKKKQFLKNEIKKIILKSIIQNLNIKPKIRSLGLKKINKINLKSSVSKQNNSICLKTGKIKSSFNKLNLSRHYIKTLGLKGFLQNVKIKSW